MIFQVLASDLTQARVEVVAEHLLKIGFVLGTVATDIGGNELLARLAEGMAQPENSASAYRVTHEGH